MNKIKYGDRIRGSVTESRARKTSFSKCKTNSEIENVPQSGATDELGIGSLSKTRIKKEKKKTAAREK